jgi:hypothetical protein
MTRAERKALQARGAIRTLAQQAAKRAVVAHIRSQGLWLGDFSSKEITLWAEVWLRENPEMWAQARVTAAELGFGGPIDARNPCRSDEALPAPNRNAGVAPSGQAHEAGITRASVPSIAPRRIDRSNNPHGSY